MVLPFATPYPEISPSGRLEDDLLIGQMGQYRALPAVNVKTNAPGRNVPRQSIAAIPPDGALTLRFLSTR